MKANPFRGEKLTEEQIKNRTAKRQVTHRINEVARRISIQVKCSNGNCESLYAYCQASNLRFKTTLAKVVEMIPASFKGSIYEVEYTALKQTKAANLRWLVKNADSYEVVSSAVKPEGALMIVRGMFSYSVDGGKTYVRSMNSKGIKQQVAKKKKKVAEAAEL